MRSNCTTLCPYISDLPRACGGVSASELVVCSPPPPSFWPSWPISSPGGKNRQRANNIQLVAS